MVGVAPYTEVSCMVPTLQQLRQLLVTLGRLIVTIQLIRPVAISYSGTFLWCALLIVIVAWNLLESVLSGGP